MHTNATSNAASEPASHRAAARPAVTPRAPALSFDALPRHWLLGSAAATAMANGVNLLFPAGERMFVRAVRRYEAGLDPALAAQVKGFYGQEGRHAQAHERVFDVMRAQGYEIDAFLAWYERVAFGVLERYAPPPLRLAATAALEHFTAILAEDALADGSLLAFAHPAMQELLSWHAVEELEHKAVAFDVLAEKKPGYALRMAGLAIASSALAFFWLAATRELLRQDGMTLREGARELRGMRAKGKAAGAQRDGVALRVFARGIREYARPGFHPFDRDHASLVARTLARLAEKGVVTA